MVTSSSSIKGARAARPRSAVRPARQPATGADASETRANPLFVASVEKGLVVLHAVAQSAQPASLADIVARTGLDKSAAQRFAHTLHALGYLSKDEGTRRFTLSTRVLDLAFGFLRSSPLVAAAVPHLTDASEQQHETVNLVVPDGLEIVFVFRVPVRRTSLVATLIGRRRPVYATSGGRAMLSCLTDGEARAVLDASDLQPVTSRTVIDRGQIMGLVRQARHDGFSISVEESMLGEIAVAAPVVNEAGRPVAAVQSSVSTAQWSESRVRAELAPLMLQTARLISTPLAQLSVEWPR